MTPTRLSRPLAAALLAVLAACGGEGGDTGSIGPGPRTEVAANPGDRWTLASPASVGMDAAGLARAGASADAGSGISAMLVMRHGQPVFEQYGNGFDKDTLHDLRSATKSITSLLVGIDIDEGALGGVDDTVAQWLAARGELPFFFANGAGGQYIFVVPALDLVAVFTGENYGNDTAAARPYALLDEIAAAVTD